MRPRGLRLKEDRTGGRKETRRLQAVDRITQSDSLLLFLSSLHAGSGFRSLLVTVHEPDSSTSFRGESALRKNAPPPPLAHLFGSGSWGLDAAGNARQRRLEPFVLPVFPVVGHFEFFESLTVSIK